MHTEKDIYWQRSCFFNSFSRDRHIRYIFLDRNVPSIEIISIFLHENNASSCYLSVATRNFSFQNHESNNRVNFFVSSGFWPFHMGYPNFQDNPNSSLLILCPRILIIDTFATRVIYEWSITKSIHECRSFEIDELKNWMNSSKIFSIFNNVCKLILNLYCSSILKGKKKTLRI